MRSPQVIQHVDYRSKAEDRRKELEQLQEKGLARTKGKVRKPCNLGVHVPGCKVNIRCDLE